MKKLLLSLFTIILLLSFSAQAQAEQPKTYWGLKSGIIDVDYADSIIPIGVFYGQHIQNKVYLEVEMNLGLLGGEASYYGVDSDVDLITLAGYAVYLNPVNDKWAFKGKGGLIYRDAEVTVDIPGLGKVKYGDSGIGLSFGAGGRYDLGTGKYLDIELTILESDLTFISGGLVIPF